MEQPTINVQIVRSLMSVIFEAFEGVELKDLGGDVQENTALSLAIITFLRQQMEQEYSVNYLPTVLEFIDTVQFSNADENAPAMPIVDVSPEIVDLYIDDISEAIGQVAIRVKEQIPAQKVAYLILSLLHFAMFILLSTYNLVTARNVAKACLKNVH